MHEPESSCSEVLDFVSDSDINCTLQQCNEIFLWRRCYTIRMALNRNCEITQNLQNSLDMRDADTNLLVLCKRYCTCDGILDLYVLTLSKVLF